MVARALELPRTRLGSRRCACGHFPSTHMRVVATSGTASYALVPSGPCQVCGEAACRTYAPGGTGSGVP